MVCPKCHIKMKEQKRVFHKQRKWICPRCGKVRMQIQFPKDKKTSATKNW